MSLGNWINYLTTPEIALLESGQVEFRYDTKVVGATLERLVEFRITGMIDLKNMTLACDKLCGNQNIVSGLEEHSWTHLEVDNVVTSKTIQRCKEGFAP